MPKKTVEVETIKESLSSNILYVQEVNDGFQVVDATPKVVMFLYATPKQDVFIVKGRNAIVYKEDGFWYISENKDNKNSVITIDIKF